jgi:hypothetical protein
VEDGQGNIEESPRLTAPQRVNHDCRPNADYYFDPVALKHTVQATTMIPAGSEISITYIDPHMKRDERVQSLNYSWGFPCSCSTCTLSSEQSRLSDERLAFVEDLRARFLEEGWENASPQMVETLLAVYEQERLYSYVAQASWFAALVHCAHGNRWETMRHAHRALEMGKIHEETMANDLDGFGLLELEQLTSEPEREYCWMQGLRQHETST